jgi:Fe-S oxidoreductase
LCLKEELRLFTGSADAELVSKNSYELMSYLYDMYESGKLEIDADSEKATFVYHPPCHLIALNGQDKGVGLLNKVCGTSIEEIEKGCCGLAGTCGMQKTKYDLSVEIGKEMAEAINLSDADFAMTECGACKMQIEHLTNKKVIHPVKVLYSNLTKKQ